MPVKTAIAKNWASWIRGADGYLRSDDPNGTFVSGPPNLSALPTAVSTQFLTTGQIATLDMVGKAYGATFQDPISSVDITRLTDASNPVANTGCTFAYVEGGPWVSGEWGGGNYTIFVMVNASGYSGYFVDYNRTTKALSNWRSVAFGVDQRICFSSNPATPQICYYITGTTLNRYDTDANALANTGYFPHTFTGGTTPNWLQTDINDRMFVCFDAGSTTVRSWDSTTNTALNRTFVGLDEPHLERDGRYVAAITGANAICWDLQTDTISNVGTTAQFFHAAHLRSGWISAYTDGSAPWVDNYFAPVATGSPFDPTSTMSGACANSFVHWSGQWRQSVNTDQQYALAFTYGHGQAGGFGEANANHSGTINCQHNQTLAHNTLVYRRADGGDNRYLCHIGTTYTLANAGVDYYGIMGGLSPDGRVAVFSSNMGTTNGRSDCFIVNVPVS